MTGIYRKPDPPIPPGATWHERIQDRSYIPTRIAAAWNILRGRPTIYRCQITSGPDTTHLGPLPDTGPIYAAENLFRCEGAYIDPTGLTLERRGHPGARQVIDGR